MLFRKSLPSIDVHNKLDSADHARYTDALLTTQRLSSVLPNLRFVGTMLIWYVIC